MDEMTGLKIKLVSAKAQWLMWTAWLDVLRMLSTLGIENGSKVPEKGDWAPSLASPSANSFPFIPT